MFTFILFVLFALWVFWGFYVLVMGIYRAHLAKRLTGLTKALAMPYVVIGYLLDIIINATLATIIFADIPRELLVTARLKRYIETEHGWRLKLANAICNGILDMFDPNNNHC